MILTRYKGKRRIERAKATSYPIEATRIEQVGTKPCCRKTILLDSGKEEQVTVGQKARCPKCEELFVLTLRDPAKRPPWISPSD